MQRYVGSIGRRLIVYPKVQLVILFVNALFGFVCVIGTTAIINILETYPNAPEILMWGMFAFAALCAGAGLLIMNLVLSNRILGPIYRINNQIAEVLKQSKAEQVSTEQTLYEQSPTDQSSTDHISSKNQSQVLAFSVRKNDSIVEFVSNLSELLALYQRAQLASNNKFESKKTADDPTPKNKSVRSNEKGVTLMELVIVLGIMGVLLAGTSSVFMVQIRTQSVVRFRLEVDNAMSEVRSTLNKGNACLNTVGSITLNSANNYNIANIKDMTGAVYLALNAPLNDNTIKISSISLSGYTDLTAPYGRASLKLDFQSIAEVYGPSQVSRTLTVSTVKNAAGVLTSCRVSSSGLGGDSKWMDGTITDSITYLLGNVGIGTDSPDALLAIRGSASDTSFDSSWGSLLHVSSDLTGLVGGGGGKAGILVRANASFPTAPTSRTVSEGIHVDISTNWGTANNNVNIWGTFSKAQTIQGGRTGSVAGGFFQGNVNAGAASTTSFVTQNVGVMASTYVEGLGISTTDEAIAVYAAAAGNTSAAGVVTRQIGVKIGQQNGTRINESFGVYQENANDKNYFNGRVGIGTTSPGYKLDVDGDVNIAAGSVLKFGGTHVCTIAGCTAVSDRRLKEDIKPLQNSLDNILKLQGFSYDWIDKEKFGQGQQIGLIAQDLEKVYPQAVVTDQSSGLKSVAYDHLVAPLIEAFKAMNARLNGLYAWIKNISAEQSREIASVKADNAAKDLKIKELEQRIEKIEKSLNAGP